MWRKPENTRRGAPTKWLFPAKQPRLERTMAEPDFGQWHTDDSTQAPVMTTLQWTKKLIFISFFLCHSVTATFFLAGHDHDKLAMTLSASRCVPVVVRVTRDTVAVKARHPIFVTFKLLRITFWRATALTKAKINTINRALFFSVANWVRVINLNRRRLSSPKIDDFAPKSWLVLLSRG